MKSWTRGRRVAAALLVVSSLANAVWFVLAGEDGWRVTFGVGGVMAVGLAWASGARTGRGALGRSVLVAALVLLAVAVTFVFWAAYVQSELLGGGTFLQALGVQSDPADGDGSSQVGFFLEITPRTSVAWAGLLCGIALAGLLGRVARRAHHAPARRLTRTLLVPFVILGLSAVVDGGYVAALTAALAAWWLLTLPPAAPAPAQPQ